NRCVGAAPRQKPCAQAGHDAGVAHRKDAPSVSTPTINLVGQIERKTQQRVVKLFCDTLGYDYLGDWVDRIGNRNIEPDLLTAWLRKCGVDEALITRALHFLDKAAGDTSKSLYDRNRDVYNLLRYAVKVKPGAGENTVDVWLIDWEHPEDNHFAIAEEVTVAAA